MFEWPIRVYYEDTDSGGVVYHSQYLNFMERARTEFLRFLGFEQDALKTEHHIIFVVHSMQLLFKKPARFNDALTVRTEIKASRSASILFQQSVFRDDELLCQAEVKVACLEPEYFKPKAIPNYMLKRMQGEY